ncbi:hypothetical protein G6F35_015243 [Rhizopus arrhizus]|nr:hypothetical protein G6F35_015243 [Rhizopus arrhizus]
MTRAEVKEIALAGTRQIRALADAHPETVWIYEYSPETFSLAELDFSLEVCDAVSAIWGPTPDRKMIVNLPSTVECTTANVYADQIEWMHRHLARRDSIPNWRCWPAPTGSKAACSATVNARATWIW